MLETISHTMENVTVIADIGNWLGNPVILKMSHSSWWDAASSPRWKNDHNGPMSVENHADEIKNYYDGNEISDWCALTPCTRWIIMFTFESEL